MKHIIFPLLFIGFAFSFSAFGKEKIALDFSYENDLLISLKGKQIIKEGETLKKEFGRGDIDTVLSMTPHVEKKGSEKQISVEINIKNFREGDLISESTKEIKIPDGEIAQMASKDSRLSETYKISITPKTLK